MVSSNDDGAKKIYTFTLASTLPKLYIMLDTYSKRMFPGTCNKREDNGRIILKKDGNEMKTRLINFVDGKIFLEHEKLEKGTWTIEVDITWNNQYGKDYTLKTYAERAVPFMNEADVVSKNLKTDSQSVLKRPKEVIRPDTEVTEMLRKLLTRSNRYPKKAAKSPNVELKLRTGWYLRSYALKDYSVDSKSKYKYIIETKIYVSGKNKKLGSNIDCTY